VELRIEELLGMLPRRKWKLKYINFTQIFSSSIIIEQFRIFMPLEGMYEHQLGGILNHLKNCF
jgi:hypothetical protein